MFQELVGRITLRENSEEIRSIVFVVMDYLFGVSKTDILAGKMISVTHDDHLRLENYVTRINASEPVQYLTGEAYFYGRRFFVDRSVLIPRPETELLIKTVLVWKDSAPAPGTTLRILDIGTGSGCLPITLQLELPGSEIYATDISADALDVARKNAAMNRADVTFIQHDILNEPVPVTDLAVVISNPPYVRRSEVTGMQENVLGYEPHSALFVTDEDPLVFYRAILLRTNSILSPHALVAVEINEQFGNEVADLFIQHGFKNVNILRDIDGKPRVVSGVKGTAQ